MHGEHRYEVIIEALANVGPVILAWLQTARELGREIPQPSEHLLHA